MQSWSLVVSAVASLKKSAQTHMCVGDKRTSEGARSEGAREVETGGGGDGDLPSEQCERFQKMVQRYIKFHRTKLCGYPG